MRTLGKKAEHVKNRCRERWTVDVKTHERTDRRTDGRTDGRCRWWQTRGGTEEDEVGGNPTPSRSAGNVRVPLPTSVPLSTTSSANRLALPWTHPRIHRSARRDKSPFLRRASSRRRGKERVAGVSYDTEEDSIMFAWWAASRRVASRCVSKTQCTFRELQSPSSLRSSRLGKSTMDRYGQDFTYLHLKLFFGFKKLLLLYW